MTQGFRIKDIGFHILKLSSLPALSFYFHCAHIVFFGTMSSCVPPDKNALVREQSVGLTSQRAHYVRTSAP